MPLSRLFSEASVGTLFLEELGGHNLLENNVFCTIPGICRQVNLRESRVVYYTFLIFFRPAVLTASINQSQHIIPFPHMIR